MKEDNLPSYRPGSTPDEKHRNSLQKPASGSSRDVSPPGYEVPPPDITASFSKLKLGGNNSSTKPTVDECIAHLKLLEAFSQLREDIGSTDGLFGIHDDFVPANATEQQRTEMLIRIREKRWAIYVTRAVYRFEIYWNRCLEPEARPLRLPDVSTFEYSQRVKQATPLQFTRDNLPPLGTYDF